MIGRSQLSVPRVEQFRSVKQLSLQMWSHVLEPVSASKTIKAAK
jgi:hypothetical protein